MDYFKHIDEYIQYKHFKSKDTIRMYRLALTKFKEYTVSKNIETDFGEEYFPNQIEGYRNFLEENYTSKSIDSFVKVVINYFNYLEIKGYITNFRNNIVAVDNNKVSMREIISMNEFKRIIDYYGECEDYKKQFLFYVALYTGIKAKYLAKLKYSDFYTNDDGKFVYVNKIFKISPFDIEMPDESKDIYSKILQEKKDDEVYIFINTHNNVYTQRYLRSVFQTTCQKLNLNAYTPSSFRHSAVYYYLLDNGYDANDLILKFNWTRNNYDRMYKHLFSDSDESITA